MDPDKRAQLMSAWREDCKILAAGGWPRIPSARWAPLQGIHKHLGPADAARRSEESIFIGRVIRRLYEREWKTKQMAALWGFTCNWVTHLNRLACDAHRHRRISK